MRASSSSRRVNVLRVYKIPSGPYPRKTDLGIPRPSKSAKVVSEACHDDISLCSSSDSKRKIG